jgi:protein-S-isoprenylcysteine O-methyltransferase Ste14
VDFRLPDSIPEWALIVAGGSTLIVFATSLENFFTPATRLSVPQRLFHSASNVVGALHALGFVVLRPASDRWAAVGITLYVVALLVFLGAIEAAQRVKLTRTFVLEPRPDVVLQGGPYALVRHPIYLSYSLAWLAAPIAIHSAILGGSAVLMIAGYITSAAREEADLLNSPLADQYRRYRERTAAVIPFAI